MDAKTQENAQVAEEARNGGIDPKFYSFGNVQILLRDSKTGRLLVPKSRKLNGDRAVRVVVREANDKRGVAAHYIDAIIPKELGADVEKAIAKRGVNKITAAVAGVHAAKANTDAAGVTHLNETLRVKRLTVLPDYAPCGPFGLVTFTVLRALEDGKMKPVRRGNKKGATVGAFNGMRTYRVMNADGEWIDEESVIGVFDAVHGRKSFIPAIVKKGGIVCVSGSLRHELNSRDNTSVDTVMTANRVSYTQRPRLFAAVEVISTPADVKNGKNSGARVGVRVVWDENAVNHKTGETFTDFTWAQYFVSGSKAEVERFKEKAVIGSRLLLQNASFDVSVYKDKVSRSINGGRWHAIGDDAAVEADNVLHAVVRVYDDVHYDRTEQESDYAGVNAVANTYNSQTKTQYPKFVKLRDFGNRSRHLAEHVGKGSLVAVTGKYSYEAFKDADGATKAPVGIAIDSVRFLTKSAGKPMLSEEPAAEEPMAAEATVADPMPMAAD